MNRRSFLGLLGLFGCKDELENMNIPEKLWWLSATGEAVPDEGDTTDDGKQAFLIIGDSNADGRGVTIPTVAADTLYLYNGVDLTEVTAQTVANNGDYGSPWQQFATNYKSLSTRKTVLIQKGWGGSEFYPNGDNTNWYTSGDLYQPAVDAANNYLYSKS